VVKDHTSVMKDHTSVMLTGQWSLPITSAWMAASFTDLRKASETRK